VPSASEIPRNDRLVVSLDGTKAMKYPLYKPDMVIGRGSTSDIRVTGRRTSRRHAHIFVEDGAVIVEDLGSLNGIAVNDECVRRKRLHDGDILDVGGARLRYVDLDEKSAAHSGEVVTAN
jgi:pSer/pThr/pTyr-binding forkhead associated (FHA) protein